MITAFANPHRFMAISGPLIVVFAVAALATGAGGYWLAFAGPQELDQGLLVRIMYVHVPSAWLGMAAYAVMAIASFVYFVWRHVLADVAAKCAAPLGAGFAFLTLATGSIWGKPAWGAWWVWDGRLTSMLILFLLYLGYIALRAAMDDERAAARAAAILALIGAVNLPIVKFSVDWWATLHQPASVIRLGGPTMPAEYLTPLVLTAAAFTAAFIALHLAAMRADVLRRRAGSLQRALEARA